jgi:hypothetical protein
MKEGGELQVGRLRELVRAHRPPWEYPAEDGGVDLEPVPMTSVTANVRRARPSPSPAAAEDPGDAELPDDEPDHLPPGAAHDRTPPLADGNRADLAVTKG